MSVKNKKIMSIIVYYTLMGFALLASAFFIYALVVKDVAMWAKVLYFVWVGFVIGAIIFDIICTSTGQAKSVSGLIIYVLSVIAVLMAGVLYCVNTGAAGLADSFFNLFISISIISLITTGFMVAGWVVGESLVEHTTAEDSMDRNR